jgi:branched-chain amino acid transport system substrate-binding protein
MLELTVLDDRDDPALGAQRLTEGLRDGHVDLAVSLEVEPAPDMLRAASDLRRVLLLARGGEPAGNRYVFRTAHTASQLALACVMALGVPELNLFAVAPDTPNGHNAVAVLKDALERVHRGVFFSGSKFIRTDDPDIGATVSSEYDDLHYLHGAKTLLVLWSGSHPPLAEIAATNPGRFGIRLALCGDMNTVARSAEPVPSLEGVTSYFPTLPHNAANNWLIAKVDESARERPDAAMVDGMAAAIAVVGALAAAPSTEADALISGLEGSSFETPKGRMTIRTEDHQALQSMFQFRVEPPANRPELAREILGSEIEP